jgi:hypothetical protein
VTTAISPYEHVKFQNQLLMNSKYEEGYDAALVEHHVSAYKLAGNHCELHKEHRPLPLETEVHHKWPLGMGGPDKPENKIKVCPTSHSTIHVLIRMLVNGVELPKNGLAHEKELAHEGYNKWVAAGKPGRA